MRKTTRIAFSIALLAALPITAAHAYIGPGAGAGTIAVVLGILSSIFLAFVGIIWYPIKRLFRGRKGRAKASAIGPSGAAAVAATRADSGSAAPAPTLDDDDEPVTQ